MKYIGKFGEYLVLTKLLENGFEAYPAIKTNQDDYDLTVILNINDVARIQVKTRDLNSKSTNNSISGVDKEYDFLVVVIVGECEQAQAFILTKEEALNLKGENKKLSTSEKIEGASVVRADLKVYRDKWEKIKGQ